MRRIDHFTSVMRLGKKSFLYCTVQRTVVWNGWYCYNYWMNWPRLWVNVNGSILPQYHWITPVIPCVDWRYGYLRYPYHCCPRMIGGRHQSWDWRRGCIMGFIRLGILWKIHSNVRYDWQLYVTRYIVMWFAPNNAHPHLMIWYYLVMWTVNGKIYHCKIWESFVYIVIICII